MGGRGGHEERSSRARVAIAVACFAALVAIAVACTDFSDLSVPKDAAASSATDAGAALCSGDGVHFEAATGRCYRVVAARIAWEGAESDCNVWGGHLVSIGDRAEDDLVLDLIDAGIPRPVPADAGAYGSWIGLNDRETRGKFVWSNGDPLTFANWRSGSPEPDAAVPKDCVFQYGGSAGGQWDDFRCIVQASYVCER